jgi:Fe-coproporphyrin III synthase
MTPMVATKLRDIGFAYVGISLDGIGATHDKFRGSSGAFERSVAAFRNCRAVGQKVGLRPTLTSYTVSDLDRILDFIETESIDRVCFYHLVYSGRGINLSLLGPEKTRQALNKIIDRVESWHRRGLSVGNADCRSASGRSLSAHSLAKEVSERKALAQALLQWNGGGNYGSGVGIADIDPQGNVHRQT